MSRSKRKKKNRRYNHRQLCTNGCNYADMWMNCKQLVEQWRDWLCNSNENDEGRERLKTAKRHVPVIPEIPLRTKIYKKMCEYNFVR